MLAGRSLPHALMMMIPESYEDRDDMTAELRGFYAFHQCLMEAWDGPAAIAFTDGRVIGATLDRNGLRPGRWYETADGWVVLASEAGALPDEPCEHRAQGPAAAGQALPRRPRAGPDRPRRRGQAEIATQKPYAEWVEQEQLRLSELPPAPPTEPPSESLRSRQLLFGYAQEDMNAILAPLARNAEEPVGSMGNDTPLAALTGRKPLLYSYFKQLFAQVTNPPIDSIREAIVMSVRASVGSERNLLDETPEHARQLVIDNPILLDDELEQLRMVDSDVVHVVDDRHDVARRRRRGRPRARGRPHLRARRDVALAAGANILILSDRSAGPLACRSPPCSRRAPCTITSSAREHACRPASSSSRASRAACTASPRSSATAQRRSTRI